MMVMILLTIERDQIKRIEREKKNLLQEREQEQSDFYNKASLLLGNCP